MERRFDMTNFEQSLKEQADDLIMIPSKRVWNGIYNNLHPGSKWPSAAMGFLFLFTFLGVGHLNNNRHTDIMKPSEVNSESNGNGTHVTEISATNSLRRSDVSLKNVPVVSKNIFIAKKAEITSNANSLDGVNNGSTAIRPYGKVVPLYAGRSVVSGPDKQHLNNEKSAENVDNLQAGTQDGAGVTLATEESAKNFNSTEADTRKNEDLSGLENLILSYPELLSESSSLLISPLSSESPILVKTGFISQSESILNATASNEVIQQKQVAKKRKDNVKWSFYLSPSISTASFVNKTPQSSASNSSSLITVRNQQPFGMIHNSRFGYEIGTEVSYAFWKKLHLITGINFSNSGYKVVSNQVHPTFAKLTLLQEPSGVQYTQSYITHYGNGQSQNQISLNNYHLQLAIAVGLKETLFEDDLVRIDVASSIEPAYNLKSQAFLISSDGRYYVEDPDLLRKMNINGKFGTYITFKSARIKWQIGPTIGYQLLSTYEKKYPVKEHLIDYGIRIGISK